LDPWLAWKAFKEYLAVPVTEDVYDAASFQCWIDRYQSEEELRAVLVRQFSRRSGTVDTIAGRVVLEFRYPLSVVTGMKEVDVWTHDYPTLTDFAVVVEGLEEFQRLMNVTPTATDVYGEFESEP